MLFFILYLTKD